MADPPIPPHWSVEKQKRVLKKREVQDLKEGNARDESNIPKILAMGLGTDLIEGESKMLRSQSVRRLFSHSTPKKGIIVTKILMIGS